MNKIREMIRFCEESPLTFGQWLFAGLCVIVLRCAFETVMTGKEFPFIHPFYLVHFPLFFLSLLLTVIVFLHFFTQTDIVKVSKLAIYFFPLILFPAIVDFIFILVTKKEMEYFYITDHVGLNFINFFNPFFRIPDFPMTLRLEIALATFGSFLYIFLKRHKVLLSLVGAFFIFATCFFYIAIPGIFVNTCVFITPFLHAVARFFKILLGMELKGPGIVSEGVFLDQNLMIVELFVGLMTVVIWYYRYDRNKWMALVKNLRITRSLHYMLLALLGILFYSLHAEVNDYFLFLKIFGILASIFFAFQFSVVSNDIVDLDCDKISNADRPLAAGAIEKDEYSKVGFVYLAFAFLFSLWVSDACFMMTMIFVAFYAVYSLPPFRIKKFFLTSSLVIGIEALMAFLIGQLSLQAESTLDFAYAPIWFVVFIVFFLSSSIKDLKDTEGDRCTHVYSLCVLLGQRKARFLIAFLVFVSYAIIPLVLRLTEVVRAPFFLLPFSFLYGAVNFFYIQRLKAKEKNIFFLYFFYALVLIASIR